ncbi:MAG: Asp/Glu/hydantoin racemase [Pseudorhodobacter sp.]|jgi:allantoin racemase
MPQLEQSPGNCALEKALIVINPNSAQSVTDGIDAAMTPLRAMGIPIRCVTLAQGPPGIESQRQADLTIAPMLRLAADLTDQARGYVIACFGDPGLHALRDATTLPVLGIQEAAVMTALTLGQRFGVIAILPASIPRHLRSFGAMGVLDRLAGDRALGLGVAELAEPGRSLTAMIATGRKLRDIDGADVLIMGCAGMAAYRTVLEAELGLPVVEPCQAAAAMALGAITLGHSHRIVKRSMEC